MADIGAVERFFGELSGVSFNDLNSNHIHDASEPVLANWTVYLDLNENGRWDTAEPSAVTGADGAYLFRQLLPGSYTVRQVKPRLWDQTFPTSRTVVELESNDGLGDAMELDSLRWSARYDPNIGDSVTNTSESIPHVSIQGFGDGTFDFYSFTVAAAGERGIFDVDYGSGGDGSFDAELFLFDSSGALLASNDDKGITFGSSGSTASADSFIEHTFAQSGVYVIGVGEFSSNGGNGQITGNKPDDGDRYILQVSIENHAVSGEVDPNDNFEVAHRVLVGIGQVIEDLDFGNHADTGEIRGQVYNDLDGGGIKDDGEFGIPDWKLFLDLDQDREYDEGVEPVAMTDAAGNFVFADVPPGEYQVEQELTSGWTRTAPLSADAFSADFSNGGAPDAEGFTAESDWHVTDARAADGGHSIPHSFHFGIDTTDGEKYRANVEGRITSPIIDLTAISGTVILEFNQVLDISELETARVVVITPDGETVIADSRSGGGLDWMGNNFEPIRLDVSPFIGQPIQVAFDLQSGSSEQRIEVVDADLTAGETYFLKVEPIDGQAVPAYDLRIEGQGAPPDRFETNDNFAEATDFGVIDVRTEFGLSIDPLGGGASSPDFYQFTPASSGVLRASIEFENTFGDLDFYLYNSEREVVAASLSIADRESVAASVNAGEAYFLEVRGYSGATNPAYDLLIDAAGIAPDRFEQNDQSSQATPLGTLIDLAERHLSIETGDEDWFQFAVDQAGEAIVALDFSHALGDLDLIVYDQNLQEIGRSESTNDNESLSIVAATGQTYFVRVLEFDGATHPDYDLIIDSPGIAPDRFEANQNFASATDLGELGFRKEADLTIDLPGDVDYFQFVAYQSGPANVEVQFAQSQGDIVVSLYDSSQNLVATSRGAGWFVDDVSVTALGRYEFTVSAGNVVQAVDFGNLLSLTGGGAGQDGVIAGHVFEDRNQNRIQEPGETSIVGLEVFVDLDRNGVWSANEPQAITDANGYRFESLGPGTYNVVLNGPSTGVQTWPVRNELTVHDDRTTGGIPQSVVLDYLNDDETLDVAVANEETGNVSLFLSDANGQYTDRVDLPTGSGPFRIVSGNFDEDPGQDLVVANRFTNTISLLANRDGLFSPANITAINVGEGPIALSTGHLNDDEYLDLVVAITGSQPGTTGGLSILYGGAGGFTAESIVLGGYPISLAIGKFDDDDDFDLAIADLGVGADVGTISIWLNQSGTFVFDQTFEAGRLFSITAGDFNGDGRDDLVAADLLGGVTTFFHQSDGSYLASLSNFSAGATSLNAEDFDRDGDLDLAVSTIKPNSKGALILRNDAGAFDPQQIIGVGQFGTELAYAVTSALPGGPTGPARTQGPSVAIVKADSNRVIVLENRLAVTSQIVEIGSSQIRDDVRFGFFSEFLHVGVSNNSVAENSADDSASQVGALSVIDIDGNDRTDHTFALVSGPGDADNALFAIAGGVLQVIGGTTLNYESSSLLSVRVRATDSLGRELESAISIEVTDVNEPPSLSLAQTLFQVSDQVPFLVRQKVADVAVVDDLLGNATLGLSGPDADFFELENLVLYLKASADLDSQSNPLLDVTVSVDDLTIGATPDDSSSIAINVSSPILEDASEQSLVLGGIEPGTAGGPPLQLVAASSVRDLIPDPTITYVDGGTTATLRFKPIADQSGVSTITVTITDAGIDQTFGTSDDEVSIRSLTVTVLAVNDPPTFTLSSDLNVNENAGPQSFAGFVTGITTGGGDDEMSQMISEFVVSNDNNAIFSAEPDIDNLGMLTFTPAAVADGSATVTVQARDDGGTLRGGVDTSVTHSFVITVTPIPDTTPPRPLITTGEPVLTNRSTFDVSIDFGEPVIGFDRTDITASGAAVASAVAQGDGRFLVSIINAADGTVTIGIDASVATDVAGNANVAADPLQLTVDTTSPTPVLSTAEPDPTNNTSFDVIIDFGETVTGFMLDDLVVDHGTARGLLGGIGGRYSVTIEGQLDQIVRVGIADESAQDLAGNLSRASELFELTVLDPTPKDFGDAPTANQSGFFATYPTLRSDDGASHVIGSLFLGAGITSETNGQATPLADGDIDEGVVFNVTAVASSSSATISSVTVTASAAGLLDAWIDFNRDGDWDDTDEQIFRSETLLSGFNVLPYGIPAGAVAGETFARFRLSSGGGLSPRGSASDGEVEDYAVVLADANAAPEILAEKWQLDAVQIVVDATQIQLVSQSTIIAQVNRSEVSGISILDQNGAAIVHFASTAPVLGIVSVDLLGASSVLRLSGNQFIDTTTIGNAALQGIDEIDLTVGDHQLILDGPQIASLTHANQLLVVFDSADVVTVGSEWSLGVVELGDNDQLIRRIVAGDVIVSLDGTDDYTNPINPFDVNRSGDVTAIDALNVINELSARRFSVDPQGAVRDPKNVDLNRFRYYDVSRDFRITALDALRVINELARQSNGEGESASVLSRVEHKAEPRERGEFVAPTFAESGRKKLTVGGAASSGVVISTSPQRFDPPVPIEEDESSISDAIDAVLSSYWDAW